MVKIDVNTSSAGGKIATFVHCLISVCSGSVVLL